MTFPGLISAAVARFSVAQDRNPSVVPAVPADATPVGASHFKNLGEELEQIPAMDRIRDMRRMPASRYANEFVSANLAGEIIAQRKPVANQATVVIQPNGIIQVTKSKPTGGTEVVAQDTPEGQFAVTMAKNALRRTAIAALQLLQNRSTPVSNLHFAVNLTPLKAGDTRTLDLTDVTDPDTAGQLVTSFKRRTHNSLLVNAAPNRVIVEINWPGSQIRVIAAGDALREVGWDKVLGGGQTPVAQVQ